MIYASCFYLLYVLSLSCRLHRPLMLFFAADIFTLAMLI